MRRIAIVGEAHSGKTTLANALVEHHGFVRLGLADPLKDAACEMLTWFIDSHHNYFPDRWDGLGRRHTTIPLPIDRQEMEDGKTVFRPFLQWLGTEFAREYLKNDTCWLQMFEQRLKDFHPESDIDEGRVVCDDVRFPNEAEYLRGLSFQIIRIHRNETERLASIGSTAHCTHQSETMLDKIIVDVDLYCHNVEEIQRYAQHL
jgi:hypothetical protein